MKNDGRSAFPVPTSEFSSPGMSLRDYFAAKAMQAFLIDPRENTSEATDIAKNAYFLADAMLIVRLQ